MFEWNPIDTAPRDGSAILLWCPKPIERHYSVSEKSPNIAIGFWDDTPISVFGYRNKIEQLGRWVSIDTEDHGIMGSEYTGWMEAYECLYLDNPTHWMYLPKAPYAHP